ncbi:MAG TPA: hypothetical protein VFT09_10995, partial [Ilumatobacteraceae bacterium]|nr:hypothetical protein [Ilumatobacteraceae bacterium]
MNPTLLALATRLHTALLDPLPRPPDRTRPAGPTDPAAGRMHGDGGQATTEYALVLLAAALVALLVVGWATAGGGAAKVGRLFDR